VDVLSASLQYFDGHTIGPCCSSGTIGKQLNCDKLQTVNFVPISQLKQVFQKQTICVQDTEGIEDFSLNSSNLAACISLILVTAGSLTLMVPFKQCITPW
jgi:hypothetical protein